MKRSIPLLFILLLFAGISFSQQQNRTISGKVMSQAEDELLAGVSVGIKGKPTAVSTDINGAFKITLPLNGEITLVFKYMGYKPREVKVTDEKELTVRMQPEAYMLNEVVSIGYKTLQRKDITGAVASVNARQLKDIPINSAAEALAGRLAGVQVTANEGMPGSDVRILVRGGGSITQSNAPLYVIDGVQVEDGLSNIAPSDIESVEVLKDASETAIYGARGANGVIVVTTKGGREAKTRISYDGFFGLAQLQRKLEVMSPYDFVLRQYERSRGLTNNETAFQQVYGDFEDLGQYKNIAGIDWQEKTFGRDAVSQTHTIALTGGGKATTFNVSYTNNAQQGIMLNSKFNRQLINLKLDHRASEKLRAGFGMRYNDQKINGSGVSTSETTATYSLLRHTIKYKPLNTTGLSDDVQDEDYFNDTNTGNGLGVLNPIQLSDAQYRNRPSNNLNINGYLNYILTKGLSFRSTAGVNFTNTTINSFDDYFTSNARQNGGGLPIVNINNTKRFSLNNSNVFTYTLKKKAHNFSALLGQEIYNLRDEVKLDQLKQFSMGITPEKALGQLSLGVSSPLFPANVITESHLLSFFGGLNYVYNDKYLAKLTFRTDGSSKFATDKRWGYFPSGSIGWRISKEDFMKDVHFISDLKLRASYGASGNNRIDDYLYLTTFTTNAKYALNEIVNAGFTSSSLANKNLKWETTVTQNIGLDIALWDNRLQLNIDAYKNKVKDLLLNVRIPSISGYTTQLQNVGQTSNKGLEFQLNAIPVQNKNFSWTTNFNLAFNRNNIDRLSTASSYLPAPAVSFVSGQPSDYIVKVGKPVGSMYGFVSDGFYKVDDFNYDPATQIYTLKAGVADVSGVIGTAQPGWMKLKDRDGDNIITENDKEIIGNATPKFTGGFNQQFTYKNFDMSMFVNFVVGNDIYNANKVEFTNSYTPNTNMLAIMNNRWKTIDANGVVVQKVTVTGGVAQVTGIAPDQLAALNKDANIWMPISGTGAFYPTSWAVEDGSFLRLNNITLGYTFPVKLLSRAKINKLRVYVTANNVAVITGYSGFDPEVNVRSSNPVTPGVDYSAYPRSRTYLFGINLSL
ncbi:TonB-linked SusC/RagA family outer membrane protein [Pedobacter sp. AK017]|uniref:SusC/RagA family TonB-linked outer membrane protein n=1 Tax=Pedobacter sp. AK017 TaxID=2723073 RepID=UPI001620810B|nr:TonB-dependent receptor [Pedobacter sp. AK017]MBB5438371.1 TonB-linked SusC/RagA family outer membrane protein [Pedobacter sp. AK017]